MTEATQALVIDRFLAHQPEKVWRALTERDLLARWLLTNDFKAEVGHHFHLRAAPQPHWDGLVACEVLEVSPPRHLIYRWNVGEQEDTGLRTVVTWSLTPTPEGTLLRMEQSGFQPAQAQNRQGAEFGWTRFLAKLAVVLDELS